MNTENVLDAKLNILIELNFSSHYLTFILALNSKKPLAIDD